MSDPIMPDRGTPQSAAVSSGAFDDRSRLKQLEKRALEEAKRFIVMFLYLWLLFDLFALHQDIIFRTRGIGVAWQGAAIINALVLGKVMLIAEDLDLGRWAPRRPLIYPILLDAAILTLLFIVFHFLEEKVVAIFRAEPSKEAGLGGGGIEGLLCVAGIVFVSLIPFFAVQHLGRTLGADKLRAILFSKEPDLPESAG